MRDSARANAAGTRGGTGASMDCRALAVVAMTLDFSDKAETDR